MNICIFTARLAVLPLALAAAFSSFSQAQTTSQLKEIVVTATRTVQPLSDVVGDVTIIDREQIERSGAVGLADVLKRLPGVEVGVGSTSSVFVRGGNSSHTAVYLDGVRLDAQSGSGGVAWESIPLAQIDRIEVLRGPAAAIYGSDAITGVIQLFTRKGDGLTTPYVGAGLGNHGLRKLEVGVSGTAGIGSAFDYSIGLAHETSNGFDSQPQRLSRSATALSNPDADAYRSTSANARLGFRINRAHSLDATLLASDLKSQYDGYGYISTAPVDDLTQHKLRTAGLNWKAQWSEAYSTRLSTTDSSSRYETTPSAYLTNTHLRGYLFQNELRFGPHLVSAALERREDKLENTSVGADRTRTQNGVALGYGFTDKRHTVQFNIRHDNDSEFGGKTTGSAAYAYALTPEWRTSASAGTAFRAPTLYQRFSDYGVSTLVPETSRNLELGLRWSQGASSIGLVAYRNKLDNLINYQNGFGSCTNGGPLVPEGWRGCYANTARAKYSGATLTASHAINGVNLSASLDLQNPRDLDTGKQLARRAKQHGILSADTRWANWLLGAEAQFSGKRFDDADNTNTLSGYTLLNLSASTPLVKDWTLLARVDNLADKQYELAQTYATAGRSFYVGVKWAPK